MKLKVCGKVLILVFDWFVISGKILVCFFIVLLMWICGICDFNMVFLLSFGIFINIGEKFFNSFDSW